MFLTSGPSANSNSNRTPLIVLLIGRAGRGRRARSASRLVSMNMRGLRKSNVLAVPTLLAYRRRFTESDRVSSEPAERPTSCYRPVKPSLAEPSSAKRDNGSADRPRRVVRRRPPWIAVLPEHSTHAHPVREPRRHRHGGRIGASLLMARDQTRIEVEFEAFFQRSEQVVRLFARTPRGTCADPKGLVK